MEIQEGEQYPSQRFNGMAIDLVLAYMVGAFTGRLVFLLSMVTADQAIGSFLLLVARLVWLPMGALLFIAFRTVRSKREAHWMEMDRLKQWVHDRNVESEAEIPR